MALCFEICKRLAFRTSQAEVFLSLGHWHLSHEKYWVTACTSNPRAGTLNTKQRYKNLDLMTVYGLVSAKPRLRTNMVTPAGFIEYEILRIHPAPQQAADSALLLQPSG